MHTVAEELCLPADVVEDLLLLVPGRGGNAVVVPVTVRRIHMLSTQD